MGGTHPFHREKTSTCSGNSRSSPEHRSQLFVWEIETLHLPQGGGSEFLADARRCLRAWWRVGSLRGLRLLEHFSAFLRRDQLDCPQIA
jgi:hypothetical protein